MIATVSYSGVIAFIIKVVLHSYLLHKIGRFKITSPDDPSRLQYLFRIWFNVPKDLIFLKFLANLLHAIAFVCLVIVFIGTWYMINGE